MTFLYKMEKDPRKEPSFSLVLIEEKSIDANTTITAVQDSDHRYTRIVSFF